MNKTFKITLASYSLIHGIIDLCCASVVFYTLSLYNFHSNNIFTLVVLYNLLAFSLQAPFGILVDKLRVPKEAAIFGCILTLISFFFTNSPALVVIISGLGNAFFHVGGGSVSLNISPRKASFPGIFVAPGALGLTIGILAGKSGAISSWIYILLLLFSIIAILILKIPQIDYNHKKIKNNIKCFELVLCLLLLSVSIRALYGLTAVFAWKSNITLLYALTFAVVFGKAFGGILADKFGWIKISIIALLISAPLLAFFQDSPVLAIFGAFLFQMTMPITLTSISNILPGRPATAFGITVFALVLGALPVYLGTKPFLSFPWIAFLIILISASSLFISFKFLYNYFKKELLINL